MRLLSWNINGIRTLPQYHPWNTLKTGEAILNELNADIICFQEMKSSRTALEKHAAVPDSYNSFFSFPTMKGGYSGVAVFAKSQTAIPLKAEEGLSGLLEPKPPLTDDERISMSYPSPDTIQLVADELGRKPLSLLEIDLEGRALALDFGLFVLINLYCPNETSDERLPYKLNFHLMLEDRVRTLIQEGREVIVTGDINICSAPIDHCDGALASHANEFWEHPAREWFRNWLYPRGPLVDVIRDCWPERQGMYTCWNTKISARESNYGTRIDYFLLTRGLLRWFKHGDIQQSVKGSDHCPIYIDLHDEITTDSGDTLTIREAMKMSDSPREPPRIAAKFWKEYAGKQKLLSSFFSKKGEQTTSKVSVSAETLLSNGDKAPHAAASIASEPATPPPDAVIMDLTAMPSAEDEGMKTKPPNGVLSPTKSTKRPLPPRNAVAGPSKRKKVQADSNYPPQQTKKKKEQSGQGKLSSFFLKSQSAKTTSKDSSQVADVIELDGSQEADKEALALTSSPTAHSPRNADEFAFDFASSQDFAPSPIVTEECKTAWSKLFAPIEAPRCTVHGEVTKQYTVNKPGPNKGKTFYLCSRPLGPGYDSGKSRRLREEVDPKFRCNFFKWTSEVKKASSQS